MALRTKTSPKKKAVAKKAPAKTRVPMGAPTAESRAMMSARSSMQMIDTPMGQRYWGGLGAGPLTANDLNDLFLQRRRLGNLCLEDDPHRDIDHECRYPEIITRHMYRKMFDRNGHANRAVSLLPDECWPDDPEIKETADSGVETPFEEKLEDVDKKVGLLAMLHRIDVLSGIGHFGILLLGFNDGATLDTPAPGCNADGTWDIEATSKTSVEVPTANDNSNGGNGLTEGGGGTLLGGQYTEPLSQPDGQTTTPTGGPIELLYIRALDETLVEINSYCTDVNSSRLGWPDYYNIRLMDPLTDPPVGVGIDLTNHRVHWSRVIHVADGRLSNEVFGTPRLRPIYNYVLNLRKVQGGSAEMFWKGGFPGYSFEVDPTMGDSTVEIDQEAMRAAFYAYSNGLERYLALTGVHANALTVQVADPSKHIEVNLDAICISIACPKRVFQGSESAHLASDQDQKTWNKRLSRRQQKYLTPYVVRPTIDRLIQVGVLPQPKEYSVKWPDLNTQDDLTCAQVALAMTQALAAYVAGNVGQLMPPREYLEVVCGFDPEVIDAVEKAAGEWVKLTEEPEPGSIHLGQPVPFPQPPEPPPGSPAAKGKGKPAQKGKGSVGSGNDS